MYDVETKEAPRTGLQKTMSVFGAFGNFIFGGIEATVIAMAVSIVIYLFLFTPHEVIGRSMYPNFEDGQFLLANKLIYKISDPKQGEVIIFKHSETQDYIKRIIALEGDTIGIKDGKVYVNGIQLDESNYLAGTVYTGSESYLHEGETITVPEGEVFVLGDNRPNSSDSRQFGPIDENLIKGKAWLVFYPFSDLHIVKHATYE